jgi:hypothetical protein
MLNSLEIEEILSREGFKLKSNNKRAHGFEHEKLDWPIYVKMPSGNTKAPFVRDNPLVISPKLDDRKEAFSKIAGISVNLDGYYHNTNLNGYPKKINKGKDPISYGVDLGFDSDASLLYFIDLLIGAVSRKPSADESSDIEDAKKELADTSKTTRKALIEARKGQGKYRDELLDLWRLCSVSSFAMKEFLRASHIKPWRDSNNIERLDKYNGLLLNPILDIAFDRGFISFENDGAIIICSKYVSELSNMGISRHLKLKKVYPDQFKYLEWHREHIMRG